MIKKYSQNSIKKYKHPTDKV